MSEIREDIITGDHVIIASQRGQRPHDFKQQETGGDGEDCPFCPGNETQTPPEILAVSDDPEREADRPGWQLRVVPNKFAALDIDASLEEEGGFYNKLSGVGAAEVLIESPVHESSLGRHDLSQIKQIIKVLQERYRDLASDQRLQYIQIFKNQGGTAGASLEHPHWQIMATPLIPAVIKAEVAGANSYYQTEEDCVYCSILDYELESKARIVKTGESFTLLTPYASKYPYEVWILPNNHQSSFSQLTQIDQLARVVQHLIRKLEVGFDRLPYNLILHTAPQVDGLDSIYHWHIEISPRLSFAAGFELGTGNFINPVAPEKAAEKLRSIELD